MVVNQKRKGKKWERDAVNHFNEKIGGEWKRVPASGAMGTALGEPLLGGDIVGKVDFLPKTIRAEAKVGYGGEKQMALKREWFTKIAEEAEKTYSIPVVLGKFSGARGRSKYFAAVDFETLEYLAGVVNEMYQTTIKLLEEIEELKNGE